MDHLQEILVDNQVLLVVLLVAVVLVTDHQVAKVVQAVQQVEQITAVAKVVLVVQIIIIQEDPAAEVPEDILVMVAEEVQTTRQTMAV